MQQQEARQQGEKTYQEWMQQAEDLKERYGISDFSFEEETQNPDFCKMLQNGVSVEAAYKAVHFDEMLGGAMAATAKNVSSQVAKNIQARASRPVRRSCQFPARRNCKSKCISAFQSGSC